jgi:alginate O-acetyltransferase complex protein AlgJ
MKRRALSKALLSLTALSLSTSALFQPTSASAQESSVVIGKNNDWLFTAYEYASAADANDTATSISLLTRINKSFEAKGIALVIAIVPSKIRIHQDQLPTNKPIDAYTNEKYESIVSRLEAGGVQVANLNKAFLASAHRTSDTPLFLRLDTHWSHTGSMLAAETIKAKIESTPKLKAALAATPSAKFEMNWSDKKTNQRARDLVRLLPAGGPSFPPEQAATFKVSKAEAAQASLLGAGENVGILVMGSSFTNKNTGYPDGLRFVLQRELLDISLPVDFGPWYGMEQYLKDDAFKTRPPKLVIWEIPEREFRSPPSEKFRDPRYQSDNNAWADRVAALLK